MAEKRSKFAALADLNRAEPEAAAVENPTGGAFDVPQPAATAIDETARGRGRPATGKRSNPDWKLYSHYLKRKTQRAAVAKLQADDDDRDLSDVLQELLEKWVKS